MSRMLASAASAEKTQWVEWLLKHDANPNLSYDHYGQSRYQYPIHAATNEGNLGIVKLLVENGADMNVQDYEGDTPLLGNM